MNWLIKLAKYKTMFAIMAVLVLSFAMSPMVLAGQGDADDPFGLGDFQKGVKETLGNKPLGETVGGIINVALSLLGVVAVVIVLLGGFKWMTAGGNEEKTTEARKLIFAGIIGLAIILAAWAITLFVLKSLATATGSGVGQTWPAPQ